MPRFRWIALQGNSRGRLPPLLLFGFFITISGIPAHGADDQAACRSPFARIVSIQGTIELLRAHQNDWSRVTRLDTPLCEGDKLRTGARSRAALFIQPETLVRVDQNTRISVDQTAEETLVEFTQEDIVATSTDAHTCGAGYFITRFPRKFRVNTPHLNAAVEGTEFLVAMRCEATELSVFEGKVLAASAGANVFPSQSVVSGQTLTVGGTEPPAIKLQLKPADAVQWTLYYPPITPAGAVPVEDCSVVAQDNRVSCLIARAEQRLRAGRVEEARANIVDALAIAPYSSDAKALSSIISLVRNDKAEALRLAREAVETTANSAPAWLALSYAQQADFKLEAALTSATRAAELTPSSALAFARVAELQLSLGWTREAEKTAKQAVAANPSESRAHMILGFVHLAQINVKEAREDFGRAIESDSTEPLSRLGLGLAIIRKGNLVEGREQIEIAVALDPTNSLIRSYVGKAYYEENSKERDQLASIQFGLAKQLDPNDPTPWFYDAILKQTQNHPISAVEDLQKSIALNGNRAVNRSQLLIDEDFATRGASLARVYEDLSFNNLSLVEGAVSAIDDPGSYSAHRLLADAYLHTSRHEIARTSEMLQSQMRQPLTLGLLQPQLTEDRFSALRAIGPTSSGSSEFNPLFTRNSDVVEIDATLGSNGSWGEQMLFSGVHDRWAFGFAQLASSTPGFRENNAFDQALAQFAIQVKPSDALTIQAEARHSDQEQGDPILRFDLDTWFPVSDTLTRDYFRLGARYEFTESTDALVLVTSGRSRFKQSFLGFSAVDQLSKTTVEELQIMHRSPWLDIIVGGGHYSEDRHFESPFAGITSDTQPNASNGYTYATIKPFGHSLGLIVGASFDDQEPPDEFGHTRSQINPKIGMVWRTTFGTTIRAASFRGLKRRFFASQTLEPTQIAGFNQFYDDLDGTDSKRKGVGIDQRLTRGIFIGAEVSRRDLRVPQDMTNEVFNWKEDNQRVYLYWLLNPNYSLALSYEMEHFDRPLEFPGTEAAFTNVTTRTIPLQLNAFSSGNLSASTTVTYVLQTGDFFSFATGSDPFHGRSSFAVLDASISYRFPGRSGIVSFQVRNVFDRSFQFQDTDPLSPTFARYRLSLLRATFVF